MKPCKTFEKVYARMNCAILVIARFRQSLIHCSDNEIAPTLTFLVDKTKLLHSTRTLEYRHENDISHDP